MFKWPQIHWNKINNQLGPVMHSSVKENIPLTDISDINMWIFFHNMIILILSSEAINLIKTYLYMHQAINQNKF